MDASLPSPGSLELFLVDWGVSWYVAGGAARRFRLPSGSDYGDLFEALFGSGGHDNERIVPSLKQRRLEWLDEDGDWIILGGTTFEFAEAIRAAAASHPPLLRLRLV